MGEANRKPLKTPNENSPQNFTNIDIHVSMEVLIKPQIFTNKKNSFFIKEKLVNEKSFH